MSFIIAALAHGWSKVSGWALAAGGVLLALGAAWLKGRSEGKDVIRREQEQRRAEAITKRKELDDDVARAPSASLDARASRWVRPDDR